LRLAQIPRCARAAHHDSRKTPTPGVRELDGGDVHVALLENAVFRQQALEIVTDLQKRIAERPNIVDQGRRQVLVHASDAEIVRVHAGARGALVEHHQFLAFFETPQRWGERADIHGLGRHVEKMREQASDLAIEDADELPTFGHRDAEQSLGRQAERMLLVHRRDVIEPIEVG
jgi:hypothetical protein